MRRPRVGTIGRGSLETLVVYGFRLVVQVSLLFLLARYLGPTEFGGFAGVAALAVGLGTLSSFGLGFLVLGESAKSPAGGEALLAQAIPAAIVSAVFLVPVHLLLSRAALGSNAGLGTLALIGISELLFLPLISLLGFRLQGLGQIARSQILGIVPTTLRLFGVAACTVIAPGAGLALYAPVHALGAAAALGIAAMLAGRPVAELTAITRPSSSTLRRGVGYAVMNFTAVNPSELDKALAVRLLGASETGLYALASRGLALVTLPVVALALSAQPRIFRDSAAANPHLQRLLATLMAAAIGYGLLAATLIYFLAPPLLTFALGSQYAAIGEVIRQIAPIAPFMAARVAAGGILLALGQPLLRAGIESVALVLLVAIATMVAPEYGLKGLIWAVLGSEAAMALLSFTAVFRHRPPRTPAEPAASGNGSGRASHPM